MKLPGLTLKNKLNFESNINNACKVARAKIKGLATMRKRSNLSQAKILYNPFILSQFSYFEEKFVLFNVVSVDIIFRASHLWNQV